VCKQSKVIVKKSGDDSVFKCEECIKASLNQEQEQLSQQNQETQETAWRWFSFF
jgi:transposase-like protein